jgi:HK97 family phage major capsid protein
MKSAADLKYDKSQKIAAMKKILDTADDEDRALTAAEDGTYKTLDKDIDGIDRQIMSIEAHGGRRAKIDDLNRTINPLSGHFRPGGDRSTRGGGGFHNMAEFLFSVAALKKDGRRDERLDRMYEAREQTMGTGATGGGVCNSNAVSRHDAPGEPTGSNYEAESDGHSGRQPAGCKV